MTALIVIIGIVCIGVAIWGNMWVSRREFYRRNQMGIQEFDGFGSMIRTTAAEKFVRIATGLIGIGGVFVMSFGLL